MVLDQRLPWDVSFASLWTWWKSNRNDSKRIQIVLNCKTLQDPGAFLICCSSRLKGVGSSLGWRRWDTGGHCAYARLAIWHCMPPTNLKHCQTSKRDKSRLNKLYIQNRSKSYTIQIVQNIPNLQGLPGAAKVANIRWSGPAHCLGLSRKTEHVATRQDLSQKPRCPTDFQVARFFDLNWSDIVQTRRNLQNVNFRGIPEAPRHLVPHTELTPGPVDPWTRIMPDVDRFDRIDSSTDFVGRGLETCIHGVIPSPYY